jgi:hypothetical protein
MATIRTRYPNLVKYVERYNLETKLFYSQGETLDLSHFTHANKTTLMQHVECDLSPENLCCDGELSGPALRQKAQYLNAVKTELESFVCL